ncbi:MAG: GIY-YIG nuclease family protein [Desulfobacteraceae bacterium]|nr:GIY-YIG nuclease family protein [Desulfobacteraceae bacterium]
MWHVYLRNRKGTLYTGITTNLRNRMKQHKAELLYSEQFEYKREAAKRERQIKNFRREKKLNLIRGTKASLP